MLDNTAKLSDIITELQNLEGINQKADLKSALVSKGITVADTDSMADLISKLNSANLVLNGKRFASGTGNLTTSSPYKTTVAGIGFTPSIIIIKLVHSTQIFRFVYATNYTAYNSNLSSYLDDSYGSIVTSTTASATGGSQNLLMWTITNGQFTFQYNTGSSDAFSWIAIE